MSILNHTWALRRTVGGLALAATLFATGTASAQFGEAAGIAEAMQPDYFKRDIAVISQFLKLDEPQRAIINALFDDYQTSFEDGQAAMRKRFEDMRPELQVNDTRRIMSLVFKPFRDWSSEKAKLGDQFLARVEVVLTQDQLEQWPAMQRRLYRDRTLHRGRLSGENLNLFDVVRDMHLDEQITAQVQPVMDAYDLALHTALHQREDPITGPNNPVLLSLEEQNPEKGQIALQKHIDAQIVVRNVNDQYIETIATALPVDLGQQFRTSALERAYPRIYRETPVQRMFKVARELEGLDPSVRNSIIELETAFLAELDLVNHELLSATRSYEPVEKRQQANDFAKRMAGQQVEPKPDPTRELYAKRDEICRKYAKSLQALLTPEQFAQLPGGYRWVEAPAAAAAPEAATGLGVTGGKGKGAKSGAVKANSPSDDGS